VELDGKVLVIRRIHVRYELDVDGEVDEDAIARVLGFHAEHCPVARSIGPAIDITTEVELVRS
jgi:uncharacterized OsmC-like protein